MLDSTGVSFFMCSLLTLTLAAVRSPEAVIGVEAAFNAVFGVGLASLTVASTETCPTSIRFVLNSSLLPGRNKIHEKLKERSLSFLSGNPQDDRLGSHKHTKPWSWTGWTFRLRFHAGMHGLGLLFPDFGCHVNFGSSQSSNRRNASHTPLNKDVAI